MKINKWVIGILSFPVVIYAVFLLIPFFTGSLLDKISTDIKKQIKNQTGINIEITESRLVTTPKLTVGIKLKNLKADENGRNFLNLDNAQVKMSLLPLLLKKVELDIISADNVNLNLYVKKDGNFTLSDIEVKSADNAESTTANAGSDNSLLPFGLHLSNRLPDIRIKNYKVAFIDAETSKSYSIEGNNANLWDFIINKSVKFETNGKMILDGFVPFNYNVKLANYIMPNLSLEELIASGNNDSEQNTVQNTQNFNIIDTFKLIKDNKITTDFTADLTVKGNSSEPLIKGKANISDFSILINGKSLPKSNADIEFNDNSYKISSSIYTSQNETTNVNGTIKTGKNPNIDMKIKSNAALSSIFEIANYFAQIAGINDLKTISAKGTLDVDFSIKSDLKNITSDGHIKLNNGYIYYGLYDVQLKDIIADIILDNNSVNINRLGFSTYSIPLSIAGKISKDSACNISINTASLPIKGLLVSLGQAAILKENPISSGTLSISSKIEGKLQSPQISGDININNFNVKNIPSDTVLSFSPANIRLKTTKNGYTGTFDASSIVINNPALKVTAPNVKGAVDEKTIVLSDTKVSAEKNNFTLNGKITDYMTDKIGLDFNTTGNLTSNLKGSVNPNKMTADLIYSVPDVSTLVIPGFDKSLLKFSGNTAISGKFDNLILKGEFKVPSLNIPEIPVNMKNITAKLNGSILSGDVILDEFTSGTIKATDIKSDYKLSGNLFYLNNLQGTAYDGKFNGNIEYNIATAKTKVKLKGENMTALKAIEGAVGIKNALSGTLGFNVGVNLFCKDYNEMMKSLLGNADFEIANGVFLNLGGLDMLISAQNILSNTVLNSTVSKVKGLSTVKSASEFSYIKGNITFKNGYANLSPVTVQGPLMAYHVSGSYNLLNGTTNVIVLGRLASTVVSAMTGLGDFAVGKITKISPLFANLTSQIAKQMNESPNGIDLSVIPSLKSSDTQYKNFKVLFNGGINSKSSVKSFKWLNNVDTTEIDKPAATNATSKTQNVINQVKSTGTNVQNVINSVKNQSGTEIKEQVKEQAKQQAKQLFNSLLNGASNQ